MLSRILVSRVYRLLTLVLLLYLNIHWLRPVYNWDMIPYVGLAYEFAGATPAEAHARAYDAAKKSVDEGTFQLLAGNSDYRRLNATDATVFDQQLPMYRVKVAYPWMIQKLLRAGWDPVYASILISKIAYIALGIALFVWVSSILPFPPFIDVLAVWILMSFTPVLRLAQLSTPDALSAVVVVSALVAAESRRDLRLSMILLLLSVAIRPDNVFWLFAFTTVCVIQSSKSRVTAICASLAGTALAFILMKWAGTPSWPVLFYHAFVKRIPNEATFHSPLMFADYVRVYLQQLSPANRPQFGVVFVFLGVLAGALRRIRNEEYPASFLLIAGLFSVALWLTFPDGEDRLFAVPYLVVAMELIRTVTRQESWYLQ
ncbi:MAG TPA: hypothetical protein VFU37_17175 [Pyrinomonadaceae bacterium]|nr:hypothetical protein [Pyrinomonadaceae bacterium]